MTKLWSLSLRICGENWGGEVENDLLAYWHSKRKHNFFFDTNRLDHKIWHQHKWNWVFLVVDTLLHHSNGFIIGIWTPSSCREQQHLDVVWILTLPGWLLATAFVLMLGVATVLGGTETNRLTEGMVRPPLTLVNVDNCNLSSWCQ